MAKYGLGILEEELPSMGIPNLDPPSLDNVHDISTTVVELPPQVLEALKPPGLRSSLDAAPRFRPWEGAADLVDLSDRFDADEPKTVLDTMLLDAAELEAAGELAPEESPPQTIELHVVRDTGPLAVVESELARLPRPWVIAGALVASVAIAGVMAMLCWTIVQLVF